MYASALVMYQGRKLTDVVELALNCARANTKGHFLVAHLFYAMSNCYVNRRRNLCRDALLE